MEAINLNCNLISYECNEKIIRQMEKDICKIKINEKIGTGFFTKIPFPIKSNMKLVLITSNYLIDEDILNNNNYILIKTKENNNYQKINLNNRMKYTNKLYNITIIEIKNEDNINN